MKRPTLTVTVKQGDSTTGYDVGSLHLNFDNTVTLFSSGTPLTLPAAQIVKIDYHPAHAEWCPHCDQSISQFSKLP